MKVDMSTTDRLQILPDKYVKDLVAGIGSIRPAKNSPRGKPVTSGEEDCWVWCGYLPTNTVLLRTKIKTLFEMDHARPSLPVLSLDLAIINTDISVPTVNAERGSYGTIFHRVLEAAALRTKSPIQINSTEFDAVNGALPSTSPDYLVNIDAILVSGSVHTVFKSRGNDWIARLDAFLGYVYFNHPHIRIFGSCFGHQIICQSLLRRLGVDAHVERNPAGWELGVHEVELTESFRKDVGPLVTKNVDQEGLKSLKIQLVHGDQVKLPMSTDGNPVLPFSWSLVGSTQKCAVQGVYQPGRVLTLQGHFEFDGWTNAETIKDFGEHWNDAERVAEGVRRARDNEDDGAKIAAMVLLFLTKGQDITRDGSHVMDLGEHVQVTSNVGWVPWSRLSHLLGWLENIMSRTSTW
ncbi:class I glutamine amidotransferase-like protein [Diaporthe eres]|nr:class I glutamine amidotransferase-like protein [Diaporthe eres]